MEINSFFHKLQEDESYKEAVEKAEKRFSFQPFAKEYKDMFTGARIAVYMLPSFSVLTGAMFIASVAMLMLGSFPIALICAVLLVALWEYLKAITLKVGTVDYYKSGKKFMFLLPFAVLLCGGSIFISLQGAKEVHKQLNTSQSDYSLLNQVQRDSINSYYNGEKQKLDNAMTEYKSSVSWKGKIDIHNKANKAYFENYTKQIDALEQQRIEELKQLADSHKVEAKEIEQSFNLNESVVLAIVICVELFILLANWFLIFYDYKTIAELKTMKQPEPVKVQISEVRDLINSYLVPHSVSTQLPLNNGTQIGFQSALSSAHSVPKNCANSSKNSDSLSAALNDGNTLKEDIENGILDYRTLAKKHKVNFGTIKENITKYAKN